MRLKILRKELSWLREWEKQLDEIEGKVQVLMNEPKPVSKENPPQLDLFEENTEINGTRK